MDRLKISLADISSTGAQVDMTVAVAALRPKDTVGDIPTGEVTVRGSLQEVDNEFFFKGTLSGEYSRPCDRCLEDSAVPFDIEVLWSYEPGRVEAVTDAEEEDIEPEDEDRLDTFTFEGNEIDLAPQVWEELALAMPSKFLCHTECKGLCPSCGTNLNLNSCECREESIDNKGLAGLADLLPRLVPKKED